MSKCPCGSGIDYKECCEKYILKKEYPETAKLLMKSRYSAYVNGEIKYILETNHPSTRDDSQYEAIKAWSESADWQSLVILETEKGEKVDDTGIVEFQVMFKINNVPQIHHERSVFDKIDNKWYYTSQVEVKQVEKSAQKIGRNSLCPCGSGKKYKKCCG